MLTKKNYESVINRLTFGVPQGGHHSPLLFSLFINSVSSVLSTSRILCFADDIKLFSCVSSLEDCMLLQIDFDRFTEWFNTLGLSLNVSKCKTMTYTKFGTPSNMHIILGQLLSHALMAVLLILGLFLLVISIRVPTLNINISVARLLEPWDLY